MEKIKLILVGFFIMILSSAMVAQQSTRDGDNPPDPPGGHGSGNDEEPGGGAPIGSGIFVLLGLGAAYGGKKTYDLRKNNDKQ